MRRAASGLLVTEPPDPGEDLPVTNGLVLDLDASKLDLNDNDAVATWPDQSGLGNDAEQTSGSSQPTYKANVLNSLPVVDFGNNSDYLVVPHHGSLNVTNITVFLVVMVKSAGLSNFEAFVHKGPNEAYQLFAGDSSAYRPWMRLDISGTTDVGRGAGSLLARNEFTVQSWRYDGDYGEFRVDGQGEWLDGSASGDIDPSSSDLGIFYQSTFTTNTIGGQLAQLVIYDRALTTVERDDVESHLASKWGLT